MVRLNKALLAVTLVALVFSTGRSSAQRPTFVGGEILVKFRPGVAASAKADAHRASGGSQAAEIQRTGLQRVIVPAGDELAAIERYRRNPNVLSAEPNFVRTIESDPLVPADYQFGQTWGLHNTGQQFYCIIPGFCLYVGTPDADIDAPEAWGITTGSADVLVAVIDSGIDYTHPDLAPNYTGGYDFANGDSDPMDDHGHGTHVSGTVAAALGNLTGSPAAAEGVVGVAPRARILGYKVCRADGTCDDFAIQQAIAQAIAAGARVINMSLGESAYSQSLDDAVQDAWSAGLVIVAGAGNNGTTDLFYPAALPNVISVGAFDEDHRRASFSNYGSWVDISAPGNAILSADRMSACTQSATPGNAGCYAFRSGTSMATPHVAGAAALLFSQMSHNSHVVEALLATADPVGVGGIRLDSWTMHGGLNLLAALGYSATRPVARAGDDQALTDNDESGAESVTLDGNASFDPNGTIVSYVWREGSTTVGSGPSAVVSLPVGFHTITLEVTDNDGETGTDDVTIAVHPPRQVTVTAPTPEATEAGTSPGMFRFSRTGDTSNPLSVLYKVEGTAVAGTDYQTLSGQVTIGSGYDTAEIPVTPINDSESEGNETVVVTVLADSGYYLGLPISATVTIVSDDAPADLVVSAMSAPWSAAVGSSFTVSETTKNQGAGNAGASITRYYLSVNSVLDGGDELLGSREVPPLAAGASHATTTSLTLPEDTATGGYFVIAQSDAAGAVAETSETNNNRADGTLYVGPDLTVSAMSAPATSGAGKTFTVTETTKNQGTGDAGESITRFWLSTNSSLDGGDVPLGSRTVPALAAGASDAATTTLTVPTDTTTGTYYVIGQADTANAIVETSETNNRRASTAVRIGPDLVVSAVTAPATAVAGSTFTVTETTKNQGDGDSDGSTTRFYLSANSTFDGTDKILGTRTVAPVAGDASDTASTSLTLPADTTAGSYYVIALADAENAVVETFESNNARASSATMKVGPDLIVSAMTAPGTGANGANITVTDTTRNQGTGASAPSSTGYYLSKNSTIGSGDVFLGSRSVDALAPGASASGSASLQIPLDTDPGFYYVVARADWNAAVGETSESNNDRTSGTVKIGGDLVVSALGAPSIGMATGSITITDTTANAGTSTLPESATAFYLSLNGSHDANDIFLGSRDVGPLGASQASAASTQVVIPPGTPSASYFVLGVADYSRVVPETNETNNTKAFGTLRVGPDLTVSAVTGPSTAAAGSSITVGDTTANGGGDTMPESVTSFYLSTNSAIDSTDVLLGSRPVPSLAAGASDTGSLSLVIPATTTARTYYIVAKADGPNATAESQENNNTRIRSISITAP
jgi:subtilisin family serine protease/subtilase family serine protease